MFTNNYRTGLSLKITRENGKAARRIKYIILYEACHMFSVQIPSSMNSQPLSISSPALIRFPIMQRHPTIANNIRILTTKLIMAIVVEKISQPLSSYSSNYWQDFMVMTMQTNSSIYCYVNRREIPSKNLICSIRIAIWREQLNQQVFLNRYPNTAKSKVVPVMMHMLINREPVTGIKFDESQPIISYLSLTASLSVKPKYSS